MEKEPFGTPSRRAPATRRALHAAKPDAQYWLTTMFGAILALNIPFEYMGLDYVSKSVQRVARYVKAPLKMAPKSFKTIGTPVKGPAGNPASASFCARSNRG
jgi:hypothetical protein